MKLCFPKFKSISSSGLWIDENPLLSSLPLLMVQMVVIVVVSRVLHAALRPLSQSIIVSQILTGIFLGPSALGRVQVIKELFAPTKIIALRVIGIIGVVLFQFMIGVKIDVGMLKKTGKKALAVGCSGHIVPGVLALGVYYLTRSILSDDIMRLSFDHLRNEVLTWSMSSIVVVACLLDEMNLLNSKIGRLSIGASLIETAMDTAYRRITTVYFLSSGNNVLAFGSLMAFIAFICSIIFVARPIVKRMVRKTPEGEPLADENFTSIIVMVLVFGICSVMIGHDMSLGVFFLGLALPSGPPLGSTLVDRLEGLTSALCFPVFVATIGFEVDFSKLIFFVKTLKTLLFFDFVTLLGKTIGVVAAGFLCRMPVRSILTLAVIMSAKGITELVHLHSWQDIQYLDVSFYTVLMFEIIVLAALTAPLVKFMYKPSKRYQRHRRRTVMHAKNNIELRMLSCVHTQDHVSPAVNLLESLCADVNHPICIYLLHLTQLIGRVASVLVPYRKGMSSSYASPATDHIVAAFSAFEKKKNPRCISVQPYINIAPYSSMYDDICDLALEKKASMILLPFHRTEVQGTVESTSEDLREVNVSVLRYAPCSVAILIDHGLITDIDMALSNPMNNVVVYFFGGPDDREALALAMRMALNTRVGITVIHFRLKDEVAAEDMETKLDNDIIYEFTTMNINRKNMVYREEVMEDGEEMVEFVRMTSNTFDLIIVGRRDGQESALTEGLSMWSELPELGVIGDMLASEDFGSRVSTLVVQQQQTSEQRSR